MTCAMLVRHSQSHVQDQSIKSKRLHEPAKLKAPISKIATQRIKLTKIEMQATSARIE